MDLSAINEPQPSSKAKAAILNVSLGVCWLLLANRAGRLHEKLVDQQSAP